MNIWWCEEHGAKAFYTGKMPPYVCIVAYMLNVPSADCRMQEMRLVSVDALVIEKVEGEWPAEMFKAAAVEIEQITFGIAKSNTPSNEITPKLAGHWAGRIVGAALDALADNS